MSQLMAKEISASKQRLAQSRSPGHDHAAVSRIQYQMRGGSQSSIYKKYYSGFHNSPHQNLKEGEN